MKEWINLSRALTICKDRGLSVTASGLSYAGKQHGFIRKADDNFHDEYDINGLTQYINESLEDPPPGWITIREAAEMAGLSLRPIYKRIKAGALTAKRFGRDHLYYVKKAAVEKLFSERKEDDRKI
jgi:excisionase family DNA binding protein